MLKNILNNIELITCQPDAKISDVAKMMADHNVGAVLVLDEDSDKPRGILTDRDIVVRCLAKNLDINDTTVENVLSESLATVKETDGIYDCIQKMRESGVRRMPVVDHEGKAVGVVSFGDLLAVLSEEFAALTETTCRHAEKREPMLKAA
jgi:CBS domain-containing protein